MKAIVQEGSGSADVLHLRDIQRPDLPDDRVLVRVRAASVNALDWHTVHGGRLVSAVGFLLRQPTFPIRGADLSGHIEAVGKDVTRLRPGDAVFGTARGTFAEFAIAREDRLVPKPPQLSFAQAGRWAHRIHHRVGRYPDLPRAGSAIRWAADLERSCPG